MIPTEIYLSKPLVRRLQTLLDQNPHLSLDALLTRALEVYIAQNQTQ